MGEAKALLVKAAVSAVACAEMNPERPKHVAVRQKRLGAIIFYRMCTP